MKKCKYHGEQPISHFVRREYKRMRKSGILFQGVNYVCHDYLIEVDRKRYKKRQALGVFRIQGRRQVGELKDKLLEKYGAFCKRCGFSDKRALQIDHVNGGGVKETRRMSTRGVWRKALKDTTGNYQVLCANCNWIKRAERNENVPRKD